MRTLSALLALVAGGIWPGNVTAGSATLRDFTGVWAHSAADCEAQLSGRLDEMDRTTSSQYEIIGICEDGLNPLHEPVECSAY